MKNRLTTWAAIATMAAALVVIPASMASDGPSDDDRRGMVYDGLISARAKGHPCEGMFQLAGVDGIACTHGPDPAPAGVDVTTGQPPIQGRDNVDAPGIHCDGDGTSGYRTQAIYAVSSDRTDNFASFKNAVGGYAGKVEETFRLSAEFFGGVRHVRWVTSAGCQLDVQKVVMSPTGDDTFSNTINEVRAAGFDRADRKYLIWTDANAYCGIATMYLDDRPGQENVNNGSYAMYARVDKACWGHTPSVEAHELMHNLGGVQPSAPNATVYGHCTDDSDRMCYVDGPGVVMQNLCPSSHEGRFDCNGDDYFAIEPASGSYLDQHWNTADSRFLVQGALEPQTVLDTFTRSLTASRADATHEFRSAGGTAAVVFVGKDTGATWTVRIKRTNGTVVASGTGTRRVEFDASLTAGDHVLEVSGGEGRYFANVDYEPGTYADGERLLKTFTRKLTETRTKGRHDLQVGSGAVGFAFVGQENAGTEWQLLVLAENGQVVVNEKGTRRIDTVVYFTAGDYTVIVRGGEGRYFLNTNIAAP